MHGAFVAGAVKQHFAAVPTYRAEHGNDALGRTAGQEMAVRGAKECGCKLFGLPDGAFGLVEVAGVVGFGKVDREEFVKARKGRPALVPGHVKTRGVLRGKRAQRVVKRGGHG